MTSGDTPVIVQSKIFSIGFNPSSSALFLVIRTMAQAPSFRLQELPAVTVPPCLKTGFSAASCSLS